MKFICNTKELNNACNNVIRAVGSKVTVPTVEGILIECGSNTLSLTGYDFELGINTILSAEVIEPGAIVINAKILCDIIRKLNDDEISFEVDGTEVYIECGAAQYSIKGIAADDYPELPSVNSGIPFELEQKLVYSMVMQTLFAVADSENSKPVYTGLKFVVSENLLTLIGVDGYRLAIRKEPIAYSGEELDFIVPKKTIKELIKLLDLESDEKIKISIGRRHIVFEIGNYSIISRLLDGEFIDYRSAMPKTIKTTVLVRTSDAIKCIERTTPVIENNQKNPIRCLFDKDEMKVSAVSTLGRVYDYTHANTSGERVEIGFNSKFMLDALNAADTDEVRIELAGPVSPAKLMPVSGDGFLFLVLPMRLKNES